MDFVTDLIDRLASLQNQYSIYLRIHNEDPKFTMNFPSGLLKVNQVNNENMKVQKVYCIES